eukprot:Sspe_Gene.80649::Locus_51021_Transcript_4_5_Confidence_0.273_Length_1095::g.80649::m.80649
MGTGWVEYQYTPLDDPWHAEVYVLFGRKGAGPAPRSDIRSLLNGKDGFRVVAGPGAGSFGVLDLADFNHDGLLDTAFLSGFPPKLHHDGGRRVPTHCDAEPHCRRGARLRGGIP